MISLAQALSFCPMWSVGLSSCLSVSLSLRGSLWNEIGDPLLSSRWAECIPRLSTFLSAPFTWHSRLSRGSDTKAVCKHGWLYCVECITELVSEAEVILFDIWVIVCLSIESCVKSLLSPQTNLSRCFRATAAEFSGCPATLRGFRPRANPSHCPDVAL